MSKKVVEEIRRFVKEESEKPSARYGFEPYEFHLMPMRNYAVKLAKKLNADAEIVEIAAWLHDIGSIINGRENHHIVGAEIAEQKLRELGYSFERVQRIKACILNHRGSVNNPRISLEEQIICDADAVSAFDNIGGLFKAAFIYEELNQKEAMKSVLSKLRRSWDKLSFQESRKIIKPKYEAAILLLS